MTISVEALGILVMVATGLTTLAPVLLLGLLVRDVRRGCLW
ncbi:hypothetical protein [Thiorhodospira sibirica]|nr:hypothetical protein [Thiorhodospira sibirica]